MKLEFCQQTFEKYLYIPMKICPVAAKLFHADGRTDGQTWRSFPSLFAIMRTRLIMHLQSQSVTTFNSFLQNKKLILTKLDCVIQWRSETRNVWDTGSKNWEIWARFPADARDFSLLRSVHNGPGAQYDPYSVCTRALSPEIKRSGREADHSPPFRTDVKNVSYCPTLYS